MQDLGSLYEQVSKVGFPTLFVIGLWKGWWFLKPYVDLLLERIAELTGHVQHATAQAERATSLAEQGHELAKEALEEARATRAVMEEVRDGVAVLVMQLGGEE